MHKFASGLIAGGVLAAIGVSYMMSDDKSRRRVVRDGKRAMRKAGHFIGDVTGM